MIKFFPKGAGWAGFVSFNSAIAMLAAASVAFVAIAMPADLFSRIVTDSGLSSLVAAAEPPLGTKARLAVAIAGAIIAFLGVWAVLCALDRAPSGRRRHNAINLSTDAPKLRRADQHPDAPPRPPLVASRDFGEPLDEPEASEEEYFPVAEEEPFELTTFASDPEPEPVIASAASPDNLPDRALEADPVPQAQPEIEAPLAVEQEAQSVALESLTAPLPEAADESVANLMQRLEGGLVRRERGQSSDQKIDAPVSDHPAGHRLRSAINNLERMAKRG